MSASLVVPVEGSSATPLPEVKRGSLCGRRIELLSSRSRIAALVFAVGLAVGIVLLALTAFQTFGAAGTSRYLWALVAGGGLTLASLLGFAGVAIAHVKKEEPSQPLPVKPLDPLEVKQKARREALQMVEDEKREPSQFILRGKCPIHKAIGTLFSLVEVKEIAFNEDKRVETADPYLKLAYTLTVLTLEELEEHRGEKGPTFEEMMISKDHYQFHTVLSFAQAYKNILGEDIPVQPEWEILSHDCLCLAKSKIKDWEHFALKEHFEVEEQVQ